MGDHRADIKVEFTMHGKTYRMDSYINWFDDGTGIDQRVVDFFRVSAEDAMARYHEQVDEANREQREADTERSERAELERLKKKFGESS